MAMEQEIQTEYGASPMINSRYDLFEVLVDSQIIKITEEGLVLDQGSLKSFVNRPEIISQLMKLRARYVEEDIELSRYRLPEQSVLTIQTEELLQKGVATLQENEILPRNYFEAAGLFVSGQNLVITKDMRSLCSSTSQADHKGVVSLITIGENALQANISYYLRAARRSGIALDEFQALTLSLAAQTTHEYGHAIMDGLETQGIDSYQLMRDYAHKLSLPDKSFVEPYAREGLSRSLELYIAKHTCLEQGFMSQTDCELFFEQYIRDAQEEWQEKEHVVSFCHSHAIPIEQLYDFFEKLHEPISEMDIGPSHAFVPMAPDEIYQYLCEPIPAEKLKEILQSNEIHNPVD